MDTYRQTAGASPRKASRKAERAARDEAEAVLTELHRLAEERLVDACTSFQDIAFEMEWRLTEWDRLVKEAATVKKLLAQKRRTSLQFNQTAQPRGSEVRNRTAAWQRQVAILVRRQRQHQEKMMQLADTIHARNDEGQALLKEIEGLSARVSRLERGLKRRSNRKVDDVMARMAAELSLVPDIADPQALVVAAEMVEKRLHS